MTASFTVYTDRRNIYHPPRCVRLQLLGTRQLNAHLAVARYIDGLPCRCRMKRGRLVVNWHSAESAVGKSKSLMWITRFQNRQSRIENRTSPIAWVRFRCQGQGEQDPEFGQKASLQSLHTSGRGPASTLGSQHHDNEPCHATSADGLMLIEITTSNTTPRSPAWLACQPAGQPTRSGTRADRQPVKHATHDLESGSGHLAFNVGQ